MLSFQQYLTEGESDIVGKIVKALKDAGVEPKVLNKGPNYNVSFKKGGLEHYVRPNDNGASMFYIDNNDDDDHDEPKVADLGQLTKHVKAMKG